MKNTVYIISGPAGVGKSTTSKKLVQTLSRSAYISGDDISHIPVNGRGKPWLDKDTLDLIWKNILSLVRNLLDYKYDVVIDYVAFPADVKWLAQELKNSEIKIVYVALLVDRETIIFRDRLRPQENQMGDRSLILLDEFESNTELKEQNKLYTTEFGEEQLPVIIEEIIKDDKYILS
jgi:adenylate kinase family enzyme